MDPNEADVSQDLLHSLDVDNPDEFNTQGVLDEQEWQDGDEDAYYDYEEEEEPMKDSLIELFYWRLTKLYQKHHQNLIESRPVVFPAEVWLIIMKSLRDQRGDIDINGFSSASRYFRRITIPIIFQSFQLHAYTPLQMACALTKAEHILPYIEHFSWEGEDDSTYILPRLQAFDDLRYKLIATALSKMSTLHSMAFRRNIPDVINKFIHTQNSVRKVDFSKSYFRALPNASSRFTKIYHYDSTFPRPLYLASHSSLTSLEVWSDWEIADLFDIWKNNPPPNLKRLRVDPHYIGEHMDSFKQFLLSAISIVELELYMPIGELHLGSLPNLSKIIVDDKYSLLDLLVGRPVKSLRITLDEGEWPAIERAIGASTAKLEQIDVKLSFKFFLGFKIQLLDVLKSAKTLEMAVSFKPGEPTSFPAAETMCQEFLQSCSSLLQLRIFKLELNRQHRKESLSNFDVVGSELDAVCKWLTEVGSTANRELDSVDIGFWAVEGYGKVDAHRISSEEWKISASDCQGVHSLMFHLVGSERRRVWRSNHATGTWGYE